MPQSKTDTPRKNREGGVRISKPNRSGKLGPRYSVALPSPVASQVEEYAEIVDASMSKAIAALVRLGLESYANRKSEFFKRLKDNLAHDHDDPRAQDRMVDEFRTLILGR